MAASSAASAAADDAAYAPQAAGLADKIAALPEAVGAARLKPPGKTLLPGLMDLHSHRLPHPYNETSWDDQVLKESLEYRTLLASHHAAATLQSGFTTLRDLGSEGALYADGALKRAIENSVIPGPHRFVATLAIVAGSSDDPNVRAYRSDMRVPVGAGEAGPGIQPGPGEQGFLAGLVAVDGIRRPIALPCAMWLSS